MFVYEQHLLAEVYSRAESLSKGHAQSGLILPSKNPNQPPTVAFTLAEVILFAPEKGLGQIN